MREPTLFSTARFTAAVCRALPKKRAVELAAGGSASLHAVAEPAGLGLRRLQLGALGLYAAPPIVDDATGDVDHVLGAVKRTATVELTWNVRHDHGSVAAALRRAGVACVTAHAHVLPLAAGYERVFEALNATRRNEVRRAEREGVTIRAVQDRASIARYYDLYCQLPYQQDRTPDFPLAFFTETAALDDTLVLVAEHAGEIVAGGLFFRDGEQLFYFNSAADRAKSRLFPTCAILDHAIRIACSEGRTALNMGASGGIASLATFKASWGASEAEYWRFRWEHPVATIVTRARRAALRVRRRVLGR